MSGVTVDKSAVEKLASDTEGRAARIENAPRPDVTALVLAAMPDSPLIDATKGATEKLRTAATTVSGQWESMASLVRAMRAGTEQVDTMNAQKFAALGTLPTGHHR